MEASIFQLTSPEDLNLTGGRLSPVTGASETGTSATYLASPTSTTDYYTLFTETGTSTPAPQYSYAQTSNAIVTVDGVPTILIQPSSYSVFSNRPFSALTSTVEYSTDPYTWQWYYSLNSTSINHASGTGTMATFTPDFGEEYYVIFEDPESLTVQSISATVTVKPIIRPVQVTFEEAGLSGFTE